MMNKMGKANQKGMAGMSKAVQGRNSKASGAGYAKGGLVKFTGKLNTGIKPCGHKGK